MDYSDNIIQVSDLCERLDELTAEREGLAEALEEAQEATKEAREALQESNEEAQDDEDTTGQREALAEAEAEETAAEKALAEWDISDEASELKMLTDLLDALEGYGGNHKWQGNWYPDALIKSDHFAEYAQQLAEDIGDMPADSWPHRHIDWEAAADELKQDYSTVDVDGEEYYYLSC